MLSAKTYSTENELKLINSVQRELDDKQERSSLQKLKLKVYERGYTGLLQLCRIMRKNHRNELTFEEFRDALCDANISLSGDDITYLFDQLKDKTGKIYISDVIKKISPELAPMREKVLKEAFDKIASRDSDVATLKQLHKGYSVNNHRLFLEGICMKHEILHDFLKIFNDPEGNRIQELTREEFMSFYAMVSHASSDDYFFDLNIRRDFGL